MTDTLSNINPAAAIEKAKQVAERYTRQTDYLRSLTTRLPVITAALKQRKRDYEEAERDVTRLTREVAQVTEHIEKLAAWVAKNQDMPEDVAVANALADKIKRLQREIERKQRDIHRLEAGLPNVD